MTRRPGKIAWPGLLATVLLPCSLAPLAAQQTPSTSSSAPMVGKSSPSNTDRPQRPRPEIERLARAIDIVRRRYVSTTEPGKLVEDAVRGMLSRLDPDAHFFTPADLARVRAAERATAGLGLHVRKLPPSRAGHGGLLVLSTDDGSPAARAGLRSRDLITAIDDELIDGRMSVTEAGRRLGGRAGEAVRLDVTRPGIPNPLRLLLIREPASSRVTLTTTPDGIVIARQSLFAGQSGQRLVDHLEAATRQAGSRLAGVILDLRDAGGPAVDQAIKVADAFLETGTISLSRTRKGADVVSATPGEIASGAPVIVVVNAGTSSAAEVLAGALQDAKRATILGEKTAGRAVRLGLVPVGAGGASGAILLPVVRYETPAGRVINGKGIDPDVAIAAAERPAPCRDGDEPAADLDWVCQPRALTSDPAIRRAIELIATRKADAAATSSSKKP